MPKVVIEYDLPHEQRQYDEVTKAAKVRSQLSDLSEALREGIKFGEMSEAEKKLAQEVRSKLWEILHG